LFLIDKHHKWKELEKVDRGWFGW